MAVLNRKRKKNSLAIIAPLAALGTLAFGLLLVKK